MGCCRGSLENGERITPTPWELANPPRYLGHKEEVDIPIPGDWALLHRDGGNTILFSLLEIKLFLDPQPP